MEHIREGLLDSQACPQEGASSWRKRSPLVVGGRTEGGSAGAGAVRKNLSGMEGDLAPPDEIPLLPPRDAAGPEWARRGSFGRPTMRCDRANVAAQLKERRERAAGAGLPQPGLHGDGGVGAEPEDPVRHDGAPQGRPPEVRRHGFQDVHPPGAAHAAAAHRPAARRRPAVRHMAHDRPGQVRATPATPLRSCRSGPTGVNRPRPRTRM